jgi:quinol monooxygenase YgiN
MITVVSVVEIYPGREDAWHEVWQQLHTARRTAEGFRAARLFRDVDHPERYVLLQEWENRDCLDRFARHVGLTWLMDDWKLGPRAPLALVVLQEES